MKIYFLDKYRGCQEYVKSQYPKLLQPLEIYVRTHKAVPIQPLAQMRHQVLQHYCNSLLDFTPVEEKAITWYVKMVCQMMRQKANRILPKYWKFIKLRTALDWDFPYTLNDSIVLPETKVRGMVAAYCQRNPDFIVSYFKLLFHEAVHLHQKRHPGLYQKIYHDAWGFRCVKPQNIIYLPKYLNYWVTNPDAMQIKWVIPIIQSGTNQRVDWYLPLLILDPNNIQKQLGILIKLEKVYNEKIREYQYYTTPNYRTICSLKEYTEKFYGMDRQLYHPHEIMAHLITDYAVTYKEYTDAKFAGNLFYQGIMQQLIHDMYI